ncbi:hypothetical protein DRJ48_04250 [Candidatus Woesearchaeota archaeon]|nr:MAG: hypothetical protein DRJ48_04250 [Candidatus Woesearchaeota archaeon]
MGALHHVLTGLMALHKLGYVHRDIKPSNIIHARGVWCVSDYGGVATHDLTSTVKGTRTYWAPEVVEGDPSTGKFLFNQKTDIYAFGCIMLQLLRSDGRLPWQDLADNHAQAFKLNRAKLEEILAAEEGWLPGVTEQHRHVILKCLMPNREHRYYSIDELIEALHGRAFPKQKTRIASQKLERAYEQLESLLEEAEKRKGRYGNTPISLIREIRQAHDGTLSPLIAVYSKRLTPSEQRRLEQIRDKMRTLQERDKEVVRERLIELRSMFSDVPQSELQKAITKICQESSTLFRILAYWGEGRYTVAQIDERETPMDAYAKMLLLKCEQGELGEQYSSVERVLNDILGMMPGLFFPMEVAPTPAQIQKAPAIIHTSSLISKLREHITGHVVIPAGVYDIDFCICVEPSGSLEMQPGAVLRFDSYCGILCKGEFKAMGTERKRVQFIPRNPQGSWGGICLYESELGQLEFCDIKGKALAFSSKDKRGRCATFESIATTTLILKGVRFSECRYGALRFLGGKEAYLNDCEFLKSGNSNLEWYREAFDVILPLEKLVLEGCVFDGNRGRIYLKANTVEIKSCDFMNNHSLFDYCKVDGSEINSEVLIADSRFTHNTGSHGVELSKVREFEIDGCHFIKNKARRTGAGVNAYNLSTMYGRIVDCVFEGNVALVGAGFSIENGRVVFQNTKFRHNRAQAHGGAMWLYECLAEFDTCQFYDNQASKLGGGIIYFGFMPDLRRCHFRGNSPDDVYDVTHRCLFDGS